MDRRETIPEKLLRENNIRIVSEYTASQHHHDMECLACGNLWSATPKSKTQTFKKNGVSGCPECQRINLAKRTLDARLKDLETRGLVIVDCDYDGRYNHKGSGAAKFVGSSGNVYLTVFNRSCMHGFVTTAKNLFNRGVICPVCNSKRKREAFQKFQNDRSEIFQETAPEWVVYKNKVESLTKITYDEYRNEINPMGLPRTLAGTDGGYQLDHIVSKRWCFDNNKSAEWCSRKDNLQILTWEDNLMHSSKIKS